MSEEKPIRYGINWPKIEEDIVNDFKDKIVTLKEISEIKSNGKKIKTRIDKTMESEYNYIIEGDNYYSLCVLTSTHKGMIDIIYIDPPYNTGNNDFIYNDKLVDSTDPWRHSKWLEFMHKRLFLARELLKDDGVMFISIDDNEQAPLKLLCDEIFGEENVEIMIWEKVGDGYTGAGKMKLTKRFRIDHEYIIVCYKDKTKINFNKVKELPNFKSKGANPDNDPRGNYIAGIVSINEKKSSPKSNNYYTVTSPSNKETTRQWHIPKEKFDKLVLDNRIYWGKDYNGVPMQKVFIDLEREIVAPSIIRNKGSLTSAKRELNMFLGKEIYGFTPKPMLLIKYLINIVRDKSLVILDFFAGSGTTGHAVLELNKEDNGNRKFILCTNNENNICTDICYPRIRKVIEGYKYKTKNGKKNEIKGIPANLIYQRVEVSKEKMTKTQATLDENKDKVAKELIEVIKSKEETQVELKKYRNHNNFKIAINKKETKRCFICTGFDANFMPDKLEKIIEEELKIKFKDNVFYLPDDFVTDLEIERVPFPEKIVNSDTYIFGEREIKR